MSSNYLDYSCYKFLEIPTYTFEAEVKYLEKDDLICQDISEIQGLINKLKVNKRFRSTTLLRRIWIYLLKNSPHFADANIVEIAEKIGVSNQSCIDTLAKLRESRIKILDKKQFYEERSVRDFSNYISKAKYYYDKQGTISFEEAKKLEYELEVLKNRFKKSREKLSKTSFCISNTDLAEILKISKGSLDSAVFHFHKSYKKLMFDNRIDKNKKFYKAN